MMTDRKTADTRSPLAWVFIPAVVMSLGWGLRGYIGGGPFGAMIPGALVTLVICRLLGFGARASATVVAFGAFGVGFGGLMTYGQTLGLLRADETFAWGLTGTTLKGGVWGLLGGAVIGLGFAAPHLSPRTIGVSFRWLLMGVIAGIYFINAPRLIYFSDPVNKPRAESWAGLLIGALALLAYLRSAASAHAWIPWTFAAFGLVGGAIGFGPGSLFIALQVHASDALKWMPYWKYMEFFFGFAFGAALGSCAFTLRDRLVPLRAGAPLEPVESAVPGPYSPRGLLILLAGVIAVSGVFLELRIYLQHAIPALGELPATSLRRIFVQTMLGFTGLGCVMMGLSTRWRTVAWQAAISVTIVAAAVDWQDKLQERGDIDMPEAWRTVYVLGMSAVTILFVHAWMLHRRPRLMSLFLFATTVLTVIGYMKGLGMSDIWWGNPTAEAAAGGRGAYLLQQYRSELIVHAIFTAQFLIAAWWGVRELRRERLEGAGDERL